MIPRPKLCLPVLGLLLLVSFAHVSASIDVADVRPGGGVTVMPSADDLGDRAVPKDAPPTAESFTFQAEVNRLMDIIINSLYSNKDVFLRELISNASDALDKLRFLSLTKGDDAVDEDKLHIRVRASKASGLLEIADTGVGMTRDELIKNLGTIAKSGTKGFMEKLMNAAKDVAEGNAAGKDTASNLIGQFGVGFYSAYLVADRVRVESRVDGGAVNVWESGADEKFVVYESNSDGWEDRGTRISLFLKDDAKEYLEEWKLSELIKKYSQFVSFPIFLRTSEEIDVPIEEANTENDEKKEGEASEEDGAEKEKERKSAENDDDDDDEIKVEDDDEKAKREAADEEDKKPKTRKETKFSWTRLNENKPVWTRDPSEISEEEYKTFFDSISKLPGSPMARSHFKGEGDVEFKSILFIPDKAPVGLYGGNHDMEKDAIRLYVRRVLVSDKFEEGLLPRYLAFLTGIVDSDDLPINVSREMLQKSKTLDVIKRKLVRKALEMMKSLAKQDTEAAEEEEEDAKKVDDDKKDDDDEEKADKNEGDEKDDSDADKKKPIRAYVKFWNEFGKSIKLGIIEDKANKNRLAKLLRFRTSKSSPDDENDLRSLDQYLDSMKTDQDHIYYHSGANREEIMGSPFIEKLLAKGYEVILLTEPIDEHMVMELTEYEGSKFMSVSKDGFKFGDKDQKDEKDKADSMKKRFKPLTSFLKENMSSKVSKVKVSSRLSNTPCVLSTEEFGLSARMEIIMKAQAFADPDSYAFRGPSTKVMEVNPHHPLVKQMLKQVNDAEELDGDEKKAAKAKALELGHLVYDTALISSGYLVNDPAEFTKRMYSWISSSVGVDPEAPIVEEIPEPEEQSDDAGGAGGADGSESESAPGDEELNEKADSIGDDLVDDTEAKGEEDAVKDEL